MMPSRHPGEELLLDLATGHADLPQRMVLEAHCDGCRTCAATVGEMASIGGLLLADLPAVAPAGDARERLLAAIERLPPEPKLDLALPASVRAELPAGVAAPRWRRVPLSSARFAVVGRDAGTGALALLVQFPGGSTFPGHRHVGSEQLTVLAGGYADQGGDFEPGDFGLYADGSWHRPLTDPGEPCVILTRLEHPVRFDGWRGLLQRLLG